MVGNTNIRPVKSPADLDGFISLPRRIYAGDPNWVPPLEKEVRETLSDKNPFWNHAERALFMAERGGRPAGRIAAIFDRQLTAPGPHPAGKTAGSFGFFECLKDPDIAAGLLEAAASWIKAKRAGVIRGPFNPSANEECGLLVEGFQFPPVAMTPYNPPYYAGLLEGWGLRKAKDLFSYQINVGDPVPERIEKLVARVKKNPAVKVRTMDMKHYERDIRLFKEVYNDAWSANWGFRPLNDDEMTYMAGKLKAVVVPETVLFVEVKGQIAAASLCMPDLNMVLKRLKGRLGIWGMMKFLYYFRKIDRCRLTALGVKKEFQKRGFEALLYRESIMQARKAGWKWGEMSWTLEDNTLINQGIEAMGGKLYKKHRIYEKDILGPSDPVRALLDSESPV